MYRTIIIILYLAQTNKAIAQAGLNLAQSINYPQTTFEQAVVINDTIIGYGTGFSDTTTWKQGVVLTKIDSFGNILNTTIILDSLGDKLAADTHWSNIIVTSDGGYAVTAAAVSRESAFLIKLNQALEVEFIKEYADSVNISNYFYLLLETPDGYLLYGAIQRPDYYNDGFIRYVNKAGETIWFRYLATSNFHNGVLDVKRVNDTTFVAAMVNGVSASGSASSIEYFHIDGTIVGAKWF